MIKIIVFTLCIAYSLNSVVEIPNANNCAKATATGCSACWGDATLTTTASPYTCTANTNTRCLIPVTDSTTQCQLCQAGYRLDTANSNVCLSTTCTTTGVGYCSYNGTTEVALICASGYYQSVGTNLCVNTGTATNQVTNCSSAFLNNSLSGSVDGKCYACASGYILNNGQTACVASTNANLSSSCRYLDTDGVTCAECVYGSEQVNSDNTWCSAKIYALGLVSAIALMMQ